MIQDFPYGNGAKFKADFLTMEFANSFGTVNNAGLIGTTLKFSNLEIMGVEVLNNAERQVRETAGGFAFSQTILKPKTWRFQVGLNRAETEYKLRVLTFMISLPNSVKNVRLNGGSRWNFNTMLMDQLNDLMPRAVMIVSQQPWHVVYRGIGIRVGTQFQLEIKESFTPQFPVQPASSAQLFEVQNTKPLPTG